LWVCQKKRKEKIQKKRRKYKKKKKLKRTGKKRLREKACKGLQKRFDLRSHDRSALKEKRKKKIIKRNGSNTQFC
jgi:hypothetical protein